MIPRHRAYLWTGLAFLCGMLCQRYVFGAQSPGSAARLALADVQALPPELALQARYIWCPSKSEDEHAAVTFALNAAVSRSNVNVRPAIVAGGYLLRVDLAVLAPAEHDLEQLVAIWESLAVDEPYFTARVQHTVEVPRYQADDGQWYTHRIDTVVAPAEHLSEAGPLLVELTRSTVPLVRADWFLSVALSTTGHGRYYEFAGVADDQTEYLRSRGASEEQVAALTSDERAALVRSHVTGKPRRIDVFRSAGVRPSVGTGLVAITHDVFDGDVDAQRDPLRNLLELADRGREIILEKANGWHEFSLFDAAGRRVDSAPDVLAADHKIPEPHTRILQPAIGCVRCHGPHEGWQPFENHVQTLLEELRVFDDLASPASVPETLRRLAGLYTGDLSEPLRLGRNTYNDVVLRATHRGVADVAQTVSDLYGAYRYELVNAQQACRELGQVVELETAQQRFAELVGVLPPGGDLVFPEDPYVGLLKAGLAITREQWETIFVDVANRALTVAATQPREREGAE